MPSWFGALCFFLLVATLIVNSGKASEKEARNTTLATSEFVKSEPDEHGVVCYTRPQASHIQFACVKVR